jgi:thiol-disulfide isomerase/thioredoxin
MCLSMSFVRMTAPTAAGLLGLVGVVLSGGCANPEGPRAEESSARNAYPSEPYGEAVGAVLRDETFVTAEGDTLSFSQIHGEPSNRLLLLTTSAGWCSACIEEQPKLQQFHESYAADGLFVMVALFEDENFAPADAAFAARWKADHGLTCTVVADPEFELAAYYPDPNATPVTMVVDLHTMTILRISSGLDESALRAIIRARL